MSVAVIALNTQDMPESNESHFVSTFAPVPPPRPPSAKSIERQRICSRSTKVDAAQEEATAANEPKQPSRYLSDEGRTTKASASTAAADSGPPDCKSDSSLRYMRASRFATAPDKFEDHGYPREPEVVGLEPVGLVQQITRAGIEWRERIGMGSQAEVFKGFFGEKEVAIKQFIFNKRRAAQLKQEVSFIRETEVLSRLSHDHLVRLYASAFDQQPFLMIMEYCAGGTVYELLYENEEMEMMLMSEQKLKMACDVAWAMRYLHGNTPQIIHRHLKSLNLLLVASVNSSDDEPYVKVSDFGFCKMKETEEWGQMTKSLEGCWMAPEVISGDYNEKVDVYSYAMVLFEILAQEMPFEDLDGDQDVVKLAAAGQRPDLDAISPDIPEQLVELMVSCWNAKPDARPSFLQVCIVLHNIADELLD